MFRLSKYELRKNRTALFVLLAGLAALQICFLIALRGKTQDYESYGQLFLFCMQ